MALPELPAVDRLARRLQSPDYQQWRSMVEATGGCAHPVRLSGHWMLTDKTTGTVLSKPDGTPAMKSGHLFAPCGNRRESVCPACSDRYAADAFHLVRAGMSGGSKGVPVTVADKPRLFVTLTAPSFGPVHNRRTSANGKHVPCRCGRYHHEHDPAIGQPVDPSGYDYTGHVLWQAHAGKLWNRFTIYLRRHIARAAGITEKQLKDHARLSYAKVAEFQKRGIIHFHAMIRIDGPEGAADAAPPWATADLLTDAVHAAHAATGVEAPEIDHNTRWLSWGDQIDVRPIRAVDAHQVEDDQGTITDDRLASYVAKYATKGTGKSEAADRPIRSREHIDLLDASEHHRQIMRTAWDLGDLDDLDDLNLRRWCHMLAFRGHFLSKSQRYSTTFKQIRGDRQTWRLEQNLDEIGVTADSVAVINHWQMTSIGHRDPEEQELALAIADRQREARKHRYANERKD
ncbi:replication initiation protein [Saccharopolyspora terrae]|uniref:Replication initiation protein n=1 Tax=Saccharopolyspora terrae TaxID=2530384 RepID=A0A4R4VX03_9PSEU|nr:replication initiator [Saccharopolyspora terrae]TDD10608.1 replication initiation protein [Saccharopolyspora terrae]